MLNYRQIAYVDDATTTRSMQLSRCHDGGWIPIRGHQRGRRSWSAGSPPRRSTRSYTLLNPEHWRTSCWIWPQTTSPDLTDVINRASLFLARASLRAFAQHPKFCAFSRRRKKTPKRTPLRKARRALIELRGERGNELSGCKGFWSGTCSILVAAAIAGCADEIHPKIGELLVKAQYRSGNVTMLETCLGLASAAALKF